MSYMICTTCRSLVSKNNTGTCLGCQQGFKGIPCKDYYEPEPEKKEEELKKKLKKRKKEIEDILEEKKV